MLPNQPIHFHIGREQYAVISFERSQPVIQGSNATITIWDPKLGPQGIFSFSQIWIAGARRTQTIKAGWQDQKTGNWWLYLWGNPIGYWPKSIYNKGPLATSGADTILWGGEIAGYGSDRDTSGKPTALTQNQLNVYASVPNCYKYEFKQLNSSLYFFYGGPGCN
ncbi:hypothetical protein Ancab_012349 [Ancistrocladus abbreviatus]